MVSIYALVVIYNKDCADSVTCQCLKRFDNVKVMIADNSTAVNLNGEYAKKHGWQYVSMTGNKGLSKAYNCGIDLINIKNSVVCLFDDDTEIGGDYFDLLLDKILKEPEAEIFLPHVYDEVGLLSPSIADGLVFKRVKSVDEISSERINGINSGMAIKTRVFESYRFDEQYFLDYIDHAFLRDMRKQGTRITIFKAQLRQNFFGNSNASLEAAIKRFRIFKKDFKRFCGNSIKGRKFYYREIMNQKKIMYLKYKAIKALFS